MAEKTSYPSTQNTQSGSSDTWLDSALYEDIGQQDRLKAKNWELNTRESDDSSSQGNIHIGDNTEEDNINTFASDNTFEYQPPDISIVPAATASKDLSNPAQISSPVEDQTGEQTDQQKIQQSPDQPLSSAQPTQITTVVAPLSIETDAPQTSEQSVHANNQDSVTGNIEPSTEQKKEDSSEQTTEETLLSAEQSVPAIDLEDSVALIRISPTDSVTDIANADASQPEISDVESDETQIIPQQAAVIDGSGGEVTEDRETTIAGNLFIADKNQGEDHFIADSFEGTYGSFDITTDGSWTYALANEQQNVQSLAEGQQVTDAFTVTSADGTTHSISLTVKGSNDAPLMDAVAQVAAVEDGTVVSGKVTATDSDTNDAITYSAGNVDGLTFNNDGTYTFNAATYQSLGAGETTTLTVPITVQDTYGAEATKDMVIVLTGTNDAPTVSGTVLLEGVEDNPVSFTAEQLLANVEDIDTTDAHSISDISIDSAQGTLTDLGDGTYCFTPTQDFNGDVALTYTVTDGTDTVQASAALNIDATEDQAVITGTGGMVTEDTALSVTGQLDIVDPDAEQEQFNATTVQGTYGSFDITTDGSWTYALANEQQNVQSLAEGQQTSDSFTVTSADGTQHSISMTINGTNDKVSISADVDTQDNAILETVKDGEIVHLAASATDPDKEAVTYSLTDDKGQQITDGPFAIDAATGIVTVADQSQIDYETADSHTLHIQAESTDGSISNTDFQVHINDVEAVKVTDLGGDENGTPVTFTLSGQHYDPSNTDDPLAGAPKFTILVNGEQLAIDGQNVFTVEANQGHIVATDSDNTGDGINDLRLVNDTNDIELFSFKVPEEIDIEAVSISFINDAYDGSNADIDQDNIVGEDRNLVVDELNIGGTLQEDNTLAGGITYQAEDKDYSQYMVGDTDVSGREVMAWSGTMTFYPAGVPSAAIIDGEGATTTEDAEPVTGTLSIFDKNQGEDHFVADSLAGTYGSFDITEKGTWSYALANEQQNVQSLAEGQQVTDSFTVTSADGTTHSISLTVNGSNDAPLMDAVAQVAAVEDGTVISGRVTATDSDTNDAITYSAENVDGLTFNSDGTYTFDAATYQSLGAGETTTLTVPITVQDTYGAEATKDMLIVLTGTNDAPTVSGTVVLEGVEDTPASFTAEQLLAHVVDVDTTDTHSISDISIDSAQGTLTDLGDGTYCFVPTANINGEVPITYTISDGTTSVATKAVINLDPTVDSIVLMDDTAQVIELGDENSLQSNTVYGNVLTNDSVIGNSGNLLVSGVENGITINTDSNDGALKVDSTGDNPDLLGGATSLDITIEVSSSDSSSSTALLSYATDSKDNELVIYNSANGSLSLYVAGQNVSTSISSSEIYDGAQHSFNVKWNSEDGVAEFQLDGETKGTAIIAQGHTIEEDGTLMFGQEQDNNGGALDSNQIFSGTYHGIAITTNGEEKANWQSFDITEGTITDSSDTFTLEVTGDAVVNQQSISTDTIIEGQFGTLTLNADGNYSYELSDTNPQVQALHTGESLTESFSLSIQNEQTDDTGTENLLFTINGTNDAPVATSNIQIVTEAEIQVNTTQNSGALVLDSRGDNPDLLGGATSINMTLDVTSSDVDTNTALFSYATDDQHNEFLVYNSSNGVLNLYIDGTNVSTSIASSEIYDGDQHSFNVTWNSEDGVAEFQLDGEVKGTATIGQGYTIRENGTLMFGQEQDTNSGNLDTNQIFSGTYHNITIATDGEEKANWDMNTVANGQVIDSTGSYNLTLTGDYERVIIQSEPISSDEGTAIVINVEDLLLHASDVEGDTLSVSEAVMVDDSAQYGSVDFNEDGNIVFTPAESLNALDTGETQEVSFSYTIDDGHGGTATAEETIVVEGISDNPDMIVDQLDTAPKLSTLSVNTGTDIDLNRQSTSTEEVANDTTSVSQTAPKDAEDSASGLSSELKDDNISLEAESIGQVPTIEIDAQSESNEADTVNSEKTSEEYVITDEQQVSTSSTSSLDAFSTANDDSSENDMDMPAMDEEADVSEASQTETENEAMALSPDDAVTVEIETETVEPETLIAA